MKLDSSQFGLRHMSKNYKALGCRYQKLNKIMRTHNKLY